jgi:hypothetical protein
MLQESQIETFPQKTFLLIFWAQQKDYVWACWYELSGSFAGLSIIFKVKSDQYGQFSIKYIENTSLFMKFNVMHLYMKLWINTPTSNKICLSTFFREESHQPSKSGF